MLRLGLRRSCGVSLGAIADTHIHQHTRSLTHTHAMTTLATRNSPGRALLAAGAARACGINFTSNTAFGRYLSVAASRKPVPFARKLAVLFPGQGSQHVGMAHDIYIKHKAARDVIDQADRAFGGGLKTLMFEGPTEDLTATENCQPAIVAHSLAILAVLQKEYEFDIQRASFAMGHSLGEYTALVAAGALDLASAIRLVHLRGKSMSSCIPADVGPTVMRALVVKGEVKDIERLMEKIEAQLPAGEVAQIANINSRRQVVISGTRNGVDYACSIIQAKGFAGRGLDLPVSGPFHCKLMEPAARTMKQAFESVHFQNLSPEVIANISARPYGPPETIPQTLIDQCTQAVQWQRSLKYARDDGVHDWLVLGPSRALANIVKKEFPEDNVISVSNSMELEQHGPRFIINDNKRMKLNRRRALAKNNVYLDDEDVDLVNNNEAECIDATAPAHHHVAAVQMGTGLFDLKRVLAPSRTEGVSDGTHYETPNVGFAGRTHGHSHRGNIIPA